ncbi:MAG: hypothetical protein A2289_16205 [Deltaproteobacteria bacterium RIFOXYA12_FULL_58_15]|nr:MAG: hypothetical protein A2289_16205 [Deltaproteobacteria bacterium RIFOXYA12_FULL_58_15]OGR12178.1 MAG: hypothetical protein A2341_20815 [Deltaproteobacteria bacterium RIFOXYB12_FULL_58_9]
MICQTDVEGDHKSIEESIAALAHKPRGIEADLLLTKLRRDLAAVTAEVPRIDRFEVLGTIGSGGMGCVYRARDPDLDAIVGEAHLLAGRPEAALLLLDEASGALVATKTQGRTVAIVLANRGNAQLEIGDVDAAERSYRQALQEAQSDLGHDHPSLARYIDKLGRISRIRGDLPTAIRYHERAIGIREAAYGHSDRSVASSLLELGRALIAAGDLDLADKHLARALMIRVSAYGPAHLRLVDVLKARGETAFLARHPKDARSYWQQALMIQSQDSREHPSLTGLNCLLLLATKPGEYSTTELERCR